MSMLNSTRRNAQHRLNNGLTSPGGISGRTLKTFDKHAERQLAEEQRMAMLENFDMEVQDKIRSMRTQLEADKKDLVLKADCEVAQLPKCVREMNLKMFLRDYGGDVSAAVRGTLKLDSDSSEELYNLPEIPSAIRARRKMAQNEYK
ncbi:hypothetical protein GGF37_000914 [Kickxella alabastrina]|nr:hypothetical protein GGF37_000914 [Kickxella alabastrina]